MDLQEIRRHLDEIDKDIVTLFERRMALCREVAEYKIETGKPVYDAERERQKLETVRSLAKEGSRQGVEELFSQLMALSRRLQHQILAEKGKGTKFQFQLTDKLKMDGIRVVYQGIEGAYSHGAALQFFGRDVDTYHVRTWEEAMQEVEACRAEKKKNNRKTEYGKD